jgi:hypothetical protein
MRPQWVGAASEEGISGLIAVHVAAAGVDENGCQGHVWLG